jgi:hypothetical protein
MRNFIRLILALIPIGVWLGFPAPVQAQPVTIVTLCDSDDQVGAGVNLNQALAIRGDIAFNCPANATIRVNSAKLLDYNTRIDGSNNGNPITLLNAIPIAQPGISFMLQTLPIAGLELVDINFQGTPNAFSGGVISQGVSRVVKASFDGFYVGLDATRGDMTVINSRFTGNNISVSISLTMTRVRISTSQFLNNSRGVVGAAGHPAIAVPAQRAYLVERSVFGGNLLAIQYCSADDCPQPFPIDVANTIILNGQPNQVAVRGNSIRLINSTVVGNHGLGVLAEIGGEITLINSIIADNVDGNCQGTVLDGGKNIQYPAISCGVAIPSVPPQLSAKLEPLYNSPALGVGRADICGGSLVNSTDYFGQRRLVAAACSIGAVEGVIPQPPVLPPDRDRREG